MAYTSQESHTKQTQYGSLLLEDAKLYRRRIYEDLYCAYSSSIPYPAIIFQEKPVLQTCTSYLKGVFL